MRIDVVWKVGVNTEADKPISVGIGQRNKLLEEPFISQLFFFIERFDIVGKSYSFIKIVDKSGDGVGDGEALDELLSTFENQFLCFLDVFEHFS